MYPALLLSAELIKGPFASRNPYKMLGSNTFPAEREIADEMLRLSLPASRNLRRVQDVESNPLGSK